MIPIAPGTSLHCAVDDFLWPWTKSTPVVMMHGFSRNASVWDRWIPFVAEEHRVYRPELRGCGGSDVPPLDYTIAPETIIEDLLKVLDAFGLKRVHWVGESAGGLLGMVLAASHPNRIASLVLCDAPMKLNNWITSTYAVGAGKTSDAIRKFGVEEWCRKTLAHRLDQNKASHELSEWYVAQLSKTPVHVAAAMFDCFSTVDMEPSLGAIKAPVLLLSGDKSQIAAEHQRTLEGTIPKARLHLFPGYGHGINVLEPEACARAAVDFWRL